MPIYEYRCEACSEEFEEIVRGTNPEVTCPKCDSSKVKKLMSIAAFKTDKGFTSSSDSSSCFTCTASTCSSCK